MLPGWMLSTSKQLYLLWIASVFVLPACGRPVPTSPHHMLFGDVGSHRVCSHDLDRMSASPWGPVDPTAPNFGMHAPLGWATVPIMIHLEDTVVEEQKAQIAKAIETWNDAIGFDAIEISRESEPAWQAEDGLYGRLRDKKNTIGVVSKRWGSWIGKDAQVLGTAVWDTPKEQPEAISGADIVLNGEHFILGDSEADLDCHSSDSCGETTDPITESDHSEIEYVLDRPREIVDLESLALHELGHFLGLSHMSYDYDSASIMNPQLFVGQGLHKRKLSDGDVERIRRIYANRR